METIYLNGPATLGELFTLALQPAIQAMCQSYITRLLATYPHSFMLFMTTVFKQPPVTHKLVQNSLSN